MEKEPRKSKETNKYRIDGDVAYLTLNTGNEVMIDKDRLKEVLEFGIWHEMEVKGKKYVKASYQKLNSKSTISITLGKFLKQDCKHIYHKNRNPYDCTESNLTTKQVRIKRGHKENPYVACEALGTTVILLDKEYETVIDYKDTEKVIGFGKWHKMKAGDKYYAGANYSIGGGKWKQQLIHRVVMDAPKDKEVDHINHNPLDNTRNNLRVCTHLENQQNKSKHSKSGTGYKNIYSDAAGGYRVQIYADGKFYYFGRYKTTKMALKVRNKELKKLHGKFANLQD